MRKITGGIFLIAVAIWVTRHPVEVPERRRSDSVFRGITETVIGAFGPIVFVYVIAAAAGLILWLVSK